jgi:hypothetical protein
LRLAEGASDEVEQIHDAFLQSQRIVVILWHLERHELRDFCKERTSDMLVDDGNTRETSELSTNTDEFHCE